MKNILIYEYITGGGIINEDLTHELSYEAQLILQSLVDDFSKFKSIKFKYFLDYRLSPKLDSDNSILVENSYKTHETDLLQKFDYVLPIIPESHARLYSYSKFLEENKIKKILSPSKIIKIMSDKKLFASFCRKSNIQHPQIITSLSDIKKNELYLLKDRYGVGCSHIQLLKGNEINFIDNKRYILQEYLDGESFSASLFFNKGNYKLLTINKHKIKKISKKYIKIEEILVNDREIDILIYNLLRKIRNYVPSLYGFIGIDFIISKNKIYLIELNPRFTTSFTLLNKTLGINLASLIDNSFISTPICGKTCKIKLL